MEADQKNIEDTDNSKTKPREKKHKPKPKQKQGKVAAAAAESSVEASSVEDNDAERGDDVNAKENQVTEKKKRKPPKRIPQQQQPPPLPPPTIELTNSKNEGTKKKLKKTKAIDNNQKMPQNQDDTTVVYTSQNGTNHVEIDSSFTANRLVKNTKQHLVFLRELHKHGITANYYTLYRLMKKRQTTTVKTGTGTETETPSLVLPLLPLLRRSRIEESFRRYTQLWLPFVVKTVTTATAKITMNIAVKNDTVHTVDGRRGEKNYDASCHHRRALIPPTDIAYLWHCHRLAPYKYLQYMEQEFFSSSSTTTPATAEARRWIFVDPLHPFVFQLASNNNNNETTTSNNATWGKKDRQRSAFTLASQQTRTLFTEMFPDESFFLPNEQKQEEEGAVSSFLSVSVDDDNAAMDNNTGNSIVVDRVSAASSSSQDNNKPVMLSDGYDLIGSCVRQSTLLYQVSGSHYRDGSFLQEGVQNYRQFVQLTQHKQLPSLLLVPTYQIDLLWHTHILSSIEQYHTDIAAILKHYQHGKKEDAATTIEKENSAATSTTAAATDSNIHQRRILLDHDDSFDDRTQGSVLVTSFERTRQLWYTLYGTEYMVDGGMYRGEPPIEYYNSNWIPSSSSNTSTVLLTDDSNASSVNTIWIPRPITFRYIPAIKSGRYIDHLSNPYKEGYIFGSGCTL